jgi:ABC-type phosphate/phosphonate transport system substrate-binding protein
MNITFFKKQMFILAASLLLVVTAYADNKSTLVIGKVSVEQSKAEFSALMALAEKIIPQLKGEGIKKAEVYMAESVPEMIKAVRAGKVDWVSDNLFVSLILAENTRSDSFLSKFREVKKYSTVFFVKKNSELNSLKDVRKKIVIFGDQISTNRYFVPYYELTSHGYTPIVYGRSEDEAGKKRNVFYRFENEHNKLIQEIMTNALNIGVLSNEEYALLPDSTKDKLKVIHQTIAYPETLDLIRFDLDIDLKLKLKNILLNDREINKKEKNFKAGTSRFENFVAEGRDGYVFLRGIIKHDVVPTNIKKIENTKDLQDIEDQEIYERIMAEP